MQDASIFLAYSPSSPIRPLTSGRAFASEGHVATVAPPRIDKRSLLLYSVQREGTACNFDAVDTSEAYIHLHCSKFDVGDKRSFISSAVQ